MSNSIKGILQMNKNKKFWMMMRVLLAGIAVLAMAGIGLADQPLAAQEYNKNFGFKVLLTGGGWYRGVPVGMQSPTTDIVQALDGMLIEGARVYGKIDFCLWGPMVPETIRAAKAIGADIVISMGQASSTPALKLEKYGCNTAYGTDNDDVMKGYKDEAGKRIYEPIDPNGPAWYEATIPVDKAIEACLKANIPAYAGDKIQKEGYGDTWFSTAGSYLCNYAAYQVPNLAKREGLDFKFLFIHVPTKPEFRCLWMKEGKKPGPCMDIERTIEGVKIIIATAVAEETKHRVWYTDERPID